MASAPQRGNTREHDMRRQGEERKPDAKKLGKVLKDANPHKTQEQCDRVADLLTGGQKK